MKRMIGYLLVIVGFVVLASSKIPNIYNNLGFFPNVILSNLLYVGLVFLVGGFVFLLISSRSSHSEFSQKDVPIYNGNKIVGYRRS